jgi:hypothetical protein
MRRFGLFISFLFIAPTGSSGVAEELGILSAERDYKGYPKRHRLSLGNTYSLSPSQLHEVYGTRLDTAFDGSSSAVRVQGLKADVQSQTITARGLIGGDILTIGFGGQVRSYQASATNSTDEESHQFFKLTPQLAATIEDQVTIGIESDFAWMNAVEESGIRNIESSAGFLRPTAGISFHTPKLEFGLAATAPATSRMRREELIHPESQSFGLVGKEPDFRNREVYMAAHQAVFARGNLTDHWSLVGNLTHVQLDANQTNILPVLETYRLEDRMAASFQATYWTQHRSRLSMGINYRGATYSPAGYEEAGLGMRLANTYGGSIEGVWRATDDVYVGMAVASMRGERAQTFNGDRYVGREESLRMVGNLSIEL